MGPKLKKRDTSEKIEIKTTSDIGPHLTIYLIGTIEIQEIDRLKDILKLCVPKPTISIPNTLEEFSSEANKADYALLLLESASTAVRRAVRLGGVTSKVLSEWLQQTNKAEELLRELGDMAILALSDRLNAPELARHVGVSLSEDVDSLFTELPDYRDPIFDCIVENAVRCEHELPRTIGDVEVLGLEASPETGDCSDKADLAVTEYFALKSRIHELQAERDSLNSQLLLAQRSLKRHLDAFHHATNKADGDTSHIHGAFYEALSQGGDQRRREALRSGLSHTPTVADIGPLIPRAITAPFLTSRLYQSAQPVAQGAPVNPIDDFPVGTELALAPLLRCNAAAELRGGKLDIRRGVAGHQFYGPYLKPPQGRYRLDITLEFPLSDRLTRLTKRDGPMLEVVFGGDQPIAGHRFPIAIFNMSRQNVALEFDLPSYRDRSSIPGLEVRLWADGDIALTVDVIKLQRIG